MQGSTEDPTQAVGLAVHQHATSIQPYKLYRRRFAGLFGIVRVTSPFNGRQRQRDDRSLC
jgi:hypothetical protein